MADEDPKATLVGAFKQALNEWASERDEKHAKDTAREGAGSDGNGDGDKSNKSASDRVLGFLLG